MSLRLGHLKIWLPYGKN
uniref:Uncharacterized protein n=1 Tax=Arcella intermedia TaxID=1963864 RepID=A0A6B2LWQ5_9EUKA